MEFSSNIRDWAMHRVNTSQAQKYTKKHTQILNDSDLSTKTTIIQHRLGSVPKVVSQTQILKSKLPTLTLTLTLA